MEWFEAIESILDVHVVELGGTNVTLGTLVVCLVIVVATITGSRILQGLFLRQLKRRNLERSSAGVIARLLHYVIVVVGLLVALQTAGIQLGALFAAGAIFAIGLGFAMQNIAQNFVAGFILLAERSIKPGDIIELDDEPMRVEEMGIRATLVRTLEDEQMIVPNAMLVQSRVKNLTLHDSYFRIRVKVGVAYDSDVRVVRHVLECVARDLDWRSADKDPRVLFTNFGDSSLEWEVSIWIDDPWKHRIYASSLREAIWHELKRAAVVIAFPQLDVHLDRDVLDRLGQTMPSGVPMARN